MSYPANYLNRQKARSRKAASYKPHSIAVTKLYLSQVNDKGILITSVEKGFNTDNKIPLNLDHSGNFGFLQLNYKGPEFYDYFSPDSTVKVKEILLKKSSTIHGDVHNGSWDIIHIITKKESDCNYLLKKAVENNYTIILAILLEIIDVINSSRKLILYPHSKKGTPLHRAVTEKDMKIIETLLDYKLDINVKNEHGWTPLHIAVNLELSDVVDLLINKGANVNAQNCELLVPLHYAVTKSNLIILDSLLKRQVKLDVIDKDKQTPLHYAVNAGNSDAVDILLKKGANYKLKDKFDRTAFHLAAEILNLDTIEVFLKNNVKANILNSVKRTPLFYASSHYRPNDVHKETYLKVIDVFLKKGANINFRDSKGYTPLYYAMLYNNTFMGALLEYIDINGVDKEGKTALHMAVKAKNCCAVELILEKNPNINMPDKYGHTALHLALESECLPIIELLLKNKADVNSKDSSGRTALHVALNTPNITINIIKSILNSTDDINAVDYYKQTALHIVTGKGKCNAVELILEKNPNINMVDNDGITALHLALQLKCLPIIELLLENKADVNLKNTFGQTALHVALNTPNITINIIKSILNSTVDINAVDYHKQTALHIVTGTGKCDAVELILEKNPNINMPDKYGHTALHLALQLKCLPIIELLLKNKADVNSKDSSGRTALHVALNTPNITINIIKSILNSTDDINAVDYHKQTALHIVTGKGKCNAVELILEKNPNINMVDNDGNTALHLALQLGRLPIIELLLKNKADVNLKDSSGRTALHLALENPDIHYAALNHNVNTLGFFFEKNAYVNAKYFGGKTSLHVTMNSRNNYFKCVEVLLDHQADINAVDNNLVTPLHLACFIKNAEVVKYLIENGADSSMRDKDGKTVFHYTCMVELNGIPIQSDKNINNHINDLLMMLLEENMSVNCIDNLGKTPLHYAAVNNQVPSLNKFLLYIGADINIVDKNNNSACDELMKHRSHMRYDWWLETHYKQHIVKMKVLKLWVREKILNKIYKVDGEEDLQWIQPYEDNCNREIDSMKSTNLDGSNITYHDFLKKSPHDAVNFTRNQNIVNAIQSNEVIKMFPIYGHFLKNLLRDSQRRSNLYDQIQESLNICLFKQLPTVCMHEVLRYLDYSELHTLFEAIKPLVLEN